MFKNWHFSYNKIVDYVGKAGLFLISGGIGGSFFTDTITPQQAIYATIVGILCVIIGSAEYTGEN